MTKKPGSMKRRFWRTAAVLAACGVVLTPIIFRWTSEAVAATPVQVAAPETVAVTVERLLPTTTATSTVTVTVAPAPETVTETVVETVVQTVVRTPARSSEVAGYIAGTPAPVFGMKTIDGLATLMANDGTYLGKVSSSRYVSESICNLYGTYGSKYSSTSVRNEFGTYGSKYGSQGAYNQFSSTPPGIYYNSTRIGYLTKNSILPGATDPDLLFAAYGCVS